MSLRERLHDRLDMIAVFGPADAAVLAALPDALAAHIRTPSGTPLHRRPTAGQAWRHRAPRDLEALARGAIVVHDETLEPVDLVLATHAAGYRELPVSIHVSGENMTMMFPHDLFDGVAAWEHVADILQRACSIPVDERRPTVDRPVLAALRTSKLLDRDALGEVRRLRREAEQSTATAPQSATPIGQDLDRRRAGLRFITLDAPTLRHLDASDTEHEIASGLGRSTRSMRLTGLVIEAAGDALPAGVDMRVRMNVDLRRYAPRGHRVDGPFSTAYPFGTVRTVDVAAPALLKRLSKLLSSKAPLAALVGDLSGLVKSRIRHPFGSPAQPGGRSDFDLSVSVLPARIPEEFWARDTDRINAAVQMHPTQPSSPYVQISEVGDGVVLGVWNEAGLLDLDRFESSITAHLDARVLRVTPNGASA